MGKKKRINCHKCCHYYVTWDPDYPCGCRAMGFKGKQLPSSVVLKSTGEACMMFKRKVTKNHKIT
ncbi:MAG: uracil-DNA glycosylase [Thermodesulfobacteriota bacterium]|nr:uracil-DNA glycosylase [Thermodesulfobacteriota bacterium]